MQLPLEVSAQSMPVSMNCSGKKRNWFSALDFGSDDRCKAAFSIDHRIGPTCSLTRLKAAAIHVSESIHTSQVCLSVYSLRTGRADCS